MACCHIREMLLYNQLWDELACSHYMNVILDPLLHVAAFEWMKVTIYLIIYWAQISFGSHQSLLAKPTLHYY
jgi:hypothetical protein